MKVLYILSPNDRFNYGDLLFPYIVRHYLGNSFDKIVFCSTTVSDLSHVGGIPTNNFSTLFHAKKNNDNYLIVAGGDALCIDWETILSFVDKKSTYVYAIDAKLKTSIFSKYYRLIEHHATTRFPFSIGKNELSNFSGVLYNSLGGSALIKNEELLDNNDIRTLLKSVDYISVRDFATHNLLTKKGIKSNIFPDSAILMSEVFQESFLLLNISDGTRQIARNKYVFFQINYEYGKDKESFFSELLYALTLKGLHICLCPIGIAPGHSDQKPLTTIYNLLKDPNVSFIENPNIWDIMWLIKHAEIYIGTSLHGTITAMSFNTKFAVHGPDKLRNYLQTWGGCDFFSNDNIREIINIVLNDKLTFHANTQKEAVKTSFSRMESIINNNA